MKRHGFQRPFHLYQIFLTITSTLSVILFSLLVIPLMPYLWIILGSSVYSMLLVTTIIQWICLTGSDPTDRLPDPSKFCSICLKEVNEKSRHCARCGRCVYNLDHHCKWLNNCIGDTNYKQFVCLSLFFLLLSAIEMAFSIYVVVDLFYEGSSKEWATDRLGASSDSILVIKTLIIGIIAFSFVRVILMIQLLAFHLYLKFKGMTTYEFVLSNIHNTQTVVPKIALNDLKINVVHNVEVQEVFQSPKNVTNINTTLNEDVPN